MQKCSIIELAKPSTLARNGRNASPSISVCSRSVIRTVLLITANWPPFPRRSSQASSGCFCCAPSHWHNSLTSLPITVYRSLITDHCSLLLLFTAFYFLIVMCFIYPPTDGPEEIRTPDLYSAIVALSQLSYRPGSERDRSLPVGCCQGSKGLLYLIKHSSYCVFCSVQKKPNSGNFAVQFTPWR